MTLDAPSILAFQVNGPILSLGAITGMTYGLLAVGLILIYRSNRIINFAHGEIGALGAALLGVSVTEWGVPYWLAFLLAIAVSALVGAGSELAVMRRLRNAPNVMSLVATLGLGQVLLLFSLVINSQAGTSQNYPQPSFLPSFNIGVLRITPAYFGMLFATPLLVAGLALFLRRSRFGLGIRAAAANAETARMAGISAGRMSMLAWMIAGGVSAFTAIMIRPTLGFVSGVALGPGLLLRALAAAVVARLHSLPVALATGIGLGVIEQELLFNFQQGGLVEITLFAVILGGLLLQRRKGGRAEEKGSWASVQAWPPLPEVLASVRSIRNLGRTATIVGLGLAIVLGLITSNATAVRLTVILAFALVGLSIAVVTGLAGQLSLGQFAIAGVGTAVSYHIMRETGQFALGFAGAAAAAAALSVLVGLPALRIRGLMLAVVTLSFALAASGWLFQQRWVFGEGVDPGRPTIGRLTFQTNRSYYFFALAIFAVGFLFARNVWRSSLGRRLRALRDNEDSARAFTVSATSLKLQGFAVGGILAGLGGALYGHALTRVSSITFPVTANINLVAMTVLGGLGFVGGSLIGALYIIAIPAFLPLDNAGLAATSVGWLLIILVKPGGFAQIIAPIRERLIAAMARRAGINAASARFDVTPEDITEQEVASATAALGPAGAEPARIPRSGMAPGELLLDGQALHKHFGGVRAVDGVDIQVRSGETLGLIGPNGAGKTTLFELVSGFTATDSGRVVFAGNDITRLRPEERGKLGIIRSFQDAALFPTLTVTEVLMLALERGEPSSLLPAVIGMRRSDAAKGKRASELVEIMGLQQFGQKQIRELSTGTRRITELACMVALEPTLLLLDEPSSGIAQNETEALGDLIARVKDYLGTTMVVIEHDIHLIMRISTRIIAMESGRVIADGSPEQVRSDPVVLESYLGGDPRGIARSGRTRPRVDEVAGALCAASTRSGAPCSRQATIDGYCAQHLAVMQVET